MPPGRVRMGDASCHLHGLLPWTRSCFVCGQDNPHGLHAKSRIESGRVVLEYTTRERDVGYKNIVHGGILMTLADEAMTWAAIASVRKMCVAAELTVRLRKPVAPNTSLRVEAWREQADTRLVRVKAIILTADGVEVLSADGKYVPMRTAAAQLAEKDFVSSGETISPTQLTSGG